MNNPDLGFSIMLEIICNCLCKCLCVSDCVFLIALGRTTDFRCIISPSALTVVLRDQLRKTVVRTFVKALLYY